MVTVPRVRRLLPLAGVATIVGALTCVVAGLAHSAAISTIAGRVTFATAAAVAGVDSRRPGDWVSTPRA